MARLIHIYRWLLTMRLRLACIVSLVFKIVMSIGIALRVRVAPKLGNEPVGRSII